MASRMMERPAGCVVGGVTDGVLLAVLKAAANAVAGQGMVTCNIRD
jgi:hypothetical protein